MGRSSFRVLRPRRPRRRWGVRFGARSRRSAWGPWNAAAGRRFSTHWLDLPEDGRIVLHTVVAATDLIRARQIVAAVLGRHGLDAVACDSARELAKISIVGGGDDVEPRARAGLAVRPWSVLRTARRCSCFIPERTGRDSLNLIHTALGLDAKVSPAITIGEGLAPRGPQRDTAIRQTSTLVESS